MDFMIVKILKDSALSAFSWECAVTLSALYALSHGRSERGGAHSSCTVSLPPEGLCRQAGMGNFDPKSRPTSKLALE